MRTTLVGGLLFFAFILGGGPARADYEPDSEAWNGIAYLRTTASEASVTLDITDGVDLSALRPRDVLWVLFPTDELPNDDLEAFVFDGGRLIVADDRGRSGPLLERFGIGFEQRAPGNASQVVGRAMALPRLFPTEEHFLFFNVEEVVANHAAVLTTGGKPILSFESGSEHLVVEKRVGAGTVLAIADPSIFINEMLRRFYGNKQFAANVLRYYCPRDRCAVSLALPQATYTGQYRHGLGMLGSAPAVFRDAGHLLNRGLEEVSSHLARPPWSYGLVFILLLSCVWAALRPLRQPSRWTRGPQLADPYPIESPREVERRGLSAGRGSADFRAEAEVLMAEAERLMASASGEETDLEGARLRIREALLSLRERAPSAVTADQFLALRLDVESLRRVTEAELHGSRRQ